MKLIEDFKKDWKEVILPSFKTKATKAGSYSIVVTALILAVLIAINAFVSVLPSKLTEFDISSAQLYSLTSNSKVILNNLTQDVDIYWIVQSGEEDGVLEKLLNKYDESSSHVTVTVKNPDIYPTFASQYTTEDVENNAIIVECGDKYRYIPYDDIYEYTSSYYSTYVTGFDGEGVITSAINYVVNEDLPKMYILEGHGETDISDSFATAIEKANIETEYISLVSEGAVPEDADFIFIYDPQSDISEEEATILSDYVVGGGKLLVAAGPLDEEELTNLNSLLATYNITVEEGIVIESNSNYYAFSAPYILLPEIESNDITDALINENYYAIFPIANGLSLGTYYGSAEINSLLSTSGTSFSKIAGYNLSTYEMEDGDLYGPFSLGVTIETTAGGKIVWFSSGVFMDDTYVSYSSGANEDLIMNSMSWLCGESQAMAISTKSLTYEYLTISDSQASAIKTMLIGIIPALYLITGIIVVVRRKQKA